MNLTKKRNLASKVFGVGKNRIIFNQENLNEIKEAITRQDMNSLYEQGIIKIKPKKGRRKIKIRKIKRGYGNIKKKIKNRKQNYVKIVRKLRSYLNEVKNRLFIDRNLYFEVRKKIKMKYFKSKASLKDFLEEKIQHNKNFLNSNPLNKKNKKS